MIEARAIRRLAAMDIQVWHTRVPKRADGEKRQSPESTLEGAGAAGSASEKSSLPSRRIRLEAGSGRWLLVVDDADRARHAKLIEDIRATLGPNECRFGTWSDSAEAGVAAEDWPAHGIRYALVFSGHGDGHNGGAEHSGNDDRTALISGGELQWLATSGQARRALWRRLQPLLED